LRRQKTPPLGPGRIEVTSVEISASTQQMTDVLGRLPYMRASRVEEAGSLIASA